MPNITPTRSSRAIPHRPRLISSSTVVAASGAILGLYLIISSRGFPPGFNSLPGPGFFPLILGLLIVVFSVMIALEARSPRPDAPDSPPASTVIEKPPSPWFRPAITVALLVFYLLSWDSVPFLVRTPILVAGLMRASGASWRATIIAAIGFSAVVFAIFQLGLRVDLG